MVLSSMKGKVVFKLGNRILKYTVYFDFNIQGGRYFSLECFLVFVFSPHLRIISH